MSTELIKILLVEDNPGDARLLCESLADLLHVPFESRHVERLSEALQCLWENRFDVILLDLSLPDSEGFDTFTRVLARARGVPIVVLSGVDDEELAIRAVQEGAQDYLVKGRVDDGLLVRAIRYAIERNKAKTEPGPKSRRTSGKVIGFLGAKGGVGTTTVALNVASALASRGKRVIAVELRPYPGTFSLHIRRPALVNLEEILKLDPESINQRQLSSQLVEVSPALHVLFGPQEIKDFQEIEPKLAEALIMELSCMADYTILDLPCHPSRATQAAIRRCHHAMLVLERDPACIVHSKLSLGLLHTWMARKGKLGAVVVDRAKLPIPLAVTDIQAQLRCEFLAAVPHAAEALRFAQQLSKPLFLSQPEHPAAGALGKLANQFNAVEVDAVRSE